MTVFDPQTRANFHVASFWSIRLGEDVLVRSFFLLGCGLVVKEAECLSLP